MYVLLYCIPYCTAWKLYVILCALSFASFAAAAFLPYGAETSAC